jgi:hypothetical protein
MMQILEHEIDLSSIEFDVFLLELPGVSEIREQITA